MSVKCVSLFPSNKVYDKNTQHKKEKNKQQEEDSTETFPFGLWICSVLLLIRIIGRMYDFVWLEIETAEKIGKNYLSFGLRLFDKY